MFRFTVDRYTLLISDRLPEMDAMYRKHATLVDLRESDTTHTERQLLYLAVYQDDNQWPSLIVAQPWEPSIPGFPGILLLPETSLLLIGAGDHLLAYQLDEPTKFWEDQTRYFWGWSRFNDVIIMEAELELAVWNIRGEKLWTTFVEPPWSFSVDKETIQIDIMGVQESFPLYEGPPATMWWR